MCRGAEVLSVDTTPSQIGFGAGWRFPKRGGRSTAGYNVVLASATYEKEERTTSGGGKIFADSLSGFQDPKLEPSIAGGRLKF